MYAQDHMVPYMMGTEDIVMACAMGESTSNLLLSFQRVIPRPNKTGMSALFSAGLCSQLDAFQAELRYQRALYHGNAENAQDAQISMTRHLRQTARRQFNAFKMFKDEYGPPGEGCPEFSGKRDRFMFMMGILAGVQAANNDFASGQTVGVPTDLLPKVSRASKCLNSERWWGLPRALRAVIWTIVPGKSPDNVDPWKVLESTTEVADEKGVRLAYAFQVMAADNKGNTELVKETITEAVESRERKDPPKEHRLLDEISFLLMRMVSDRMWTEKKGHRTPAGELGTFWEKKEDKKKDEELDSLLPGGGGLSSSSSSKSNSDKSDEQNKSSSSQQANADTQQSSEFNSGGFEF
jgi:hypothetical protein